jgi:hypothetical protein
MKEWRGIYRFNAANFYKGAQEMRNKFINRILIIAIMVFIFILVPNASGQDMGTVSYSEGYGSHGMMGQDPDEILKYGREMMRYGFHEKGMSWGSNKYPGYESYLSDETIKKLNADTYDR